MNNNHDDATAAGIEAASGQRWKVWVSDTGQWWAARSDPLTAADLGAGCVPFLRAGSPSELARLIGDQDELHAAAHQQATRSQTVPGAQELPTTPSGDPHE